MHLDSLYDYVLVVREEHESPGIHDFEANFLRLIDKLTDGTVIEINETGTRLTVKPGIILGMDESPKI